MEKQSPWWFSKQINGIYCLSQSNPPIRIHLYTSLTSVLRDTDAGFPGVVHTNHTGIPFSSLSRNQNTYSVTHPTFGSSLNRFYRRSGHIRLSRGNLEGETQDVNTTASLLRGGWSVSWQRFQHFRCKRPTRRTCLWWARKRHFKTGWICCHARSSWYEFIIFWFSLNLDLKCES